MMDFQRRALDQETRKAKNVLATIRRFSTYFRPYWLNLVGVVAFTLVVVYCNILYPELIGQAADCYLISTPTVQMGGSGVATTDCWYTDIAQLTTNQSKIDGLLGLSLLIAGTFVISALFTGFSFYTMRVAGQSALRDMRGDMFKKMHRLSIGYYTRNEAGEIMSRVTNDMDTLQQMFNFALLNVFQGLMIIFWIGVAMLRANFIYALISLAIAPVMLFTTRYFSNQARKAFRIARQEIGNVNADLQESIAGAREVQAFNREEESIAQFQKANEANRAANVRAAVFTSALNPVLEALSYVALGTVVVVGGFSALNNQPLLAGTSVISVGTIFTFLAYIQRINQPISQIAVLWTNVQSGIAGGERIFSLMDEDIEIYDRENAKIMPTIVGKVQFNNVEAEYVKGEKVLKGVDFGVDKGEMVAIVGPTGAGKTTIINMIPRFYDVTDGEVLIDGIDVRDVTQDSLRKQIGMVLQDTFLFSDTVMENIRYGRLDASDDDIIAAAKMVAAHEFIERLPQGYQTVLGERGSGLSQGQRQLIAIARVALMNPNILILDEATSSVDTRTERVIQAAFEKLLEGRTSFVIAHRLSTIRNANLVLMVKDGLIIERGTHQELLAKGGAYYDLYMSQFKAEEDVA
ncbi:MAG TPA: ABC transporter ATP-binding protein [Aggregatilineales bacterium]|nr:ABC transporter ATP-binding protein [Aggregatilineales bacterium]